MIWILLFLPILVHCLCPDTTTCIQRVRQVVAEPKRFWFGEQRRALCHHRNANPIDCFGPHHLASFHSLGSRLFHVKTYHAAYLRNLAIFPRATYRSHPGNYRACEHEFRGLSQSGPIEVDPDMEPVEPFSIRYKPEIGWQGLQFDDEYVILMTDVGFGTLNYLVYDFPKATKTLKEYEPSENFRPSANPLVVLVFRKGDKNITVGNMEEFNLADFMMVNGLEDNLVGINVVIVGSDAFAIERQRIRGNVDNCHSLLLPKLLHHPPSTILGSLPLQELSQWLSVSYERQHQDVNVCCQRVRNNATTVFFDPLGDSTVSAMITLHPPTYTSLRMAQQNNYMNYHRQTRTYVALMDEMYSLVVVDGQSGKLHWMVVDIPAAQLSNEDTKGVEKALYQALTPADPGQCRPYLFVLFQQSHSLRKLSPYCDDCRTRKEFKLDSYKQQHGLRLAGVSWVKSCFDLSYAYHYIKTRSNETAEERPQSKNYRPNLLSRTTSISTQICSAFKVSPHHRCSISSDAHPSYSTSLFVLFVCLLFVHLIE